MRECLQTFGMSAHHALAWIEKVDNITLQRLTFKPCFMRIHQRDVWPYIQMTCCSARAQLMGICFEGWGKTWGRAAVFLTGLVVVSVWRSCLVVTEAMTWLKSQNFAQVSLPSVSMNLFIKIVGDLNRRQWLESILQSDDNNYKHDLCSSAC